MYLLGSADVWSGRAFGKTLSRLPLASGSKWPMAAWGDSGQNIPSGCFDVAESGSLQTPDAAHG